MIANIVIIMFKQRQENEIFVALILLTGGV